MFYRYEFHSDWNSVSLQLKTPQFQHHCYLWRASKYFCPSFKMAAAPAIAPILFNPANLMLFFEGADAMALSNRTRLHLAIEGILVPNNFKTLTTTDWMTSSLTLQSLQRLQQFVGWLQCRTLVGDNGVWSFCQVQDVPKRCNEDHQVLQEHWLALRPRQHDLGCHQAISGAMEGIDGA